jgi:hypothetical protein
MFISPINGFLVALYQMLANANFHLGPIEINILIKHLYHKQLSYMSLCIK